MQANTFNFKKALIIDNFDNSDKSVNIIKNIKYYFDMFDSKNINIKILTNNPNITLSIDYPKLTKLQELTKKNKNLNIFKLIYRYFTNIRKSHQIIPVQQNISNISNIKLGMRNPNTNKRSNILNQIPTRKNIIESIKWLVSDLLPGDNIYFHYYGSIEISDDEIKQLLIEQIPLNCTCFMILDCYNRYNAFNLKFNIKYLNENTITVFKDNTYKINCGSIILLSSHCNNVEYNFKNYSILTSALLHILNNRINNSKFTLDIILFKINEYIIKNNYISYYQLSSNNNINIYNMFTLDY